MRKVLLCPRGCLRSGWGWRKAILNASSSTQILSTRWNYLLLGRWPTLLTHLSGRNFSSGIINGGTRLDSWPNFSVCKTFLTLVRKWVLKTLSTEAEPEENLCKNSSPLKHTHTQYLQKVAILSSNSDRKSSLTIKQLLPPQGKICFPETLTPFSHCRFSNIWG